MSWIKLDCMDLAFAARGVEWRWKYFCGQQIARELIERQERGEA